MSVSFNTARGELRTFSSMPPEKMLAAAERFMWFNARLIDRLRFEHHFRGRPAEPVLQALLAYRTEDGGFGHSLEPDTRGSVPQPLAVWSALDLLHEVGLGDAGASKEVVRSAVEWLKKATAADGGVPFVLPSIAEVPHAPWLEPESVPTGSLLMTGLVVASLRVLGVEDRWLDDASEFCWTAIERLRDPHPYEARSALAFLDVAKDATRAQQGLAKIRTLVREKRLVALDPTPGEETHGALDFAPNPAMLARTLFDDRTIETALDALVAAQQPDGGWQIDWTVWTPIVEPEWRGVQTIRRLRALRAYGRLPPRARS
jgi:hypothetical protein